MPRSSLYTPSHNSTIGGVPLCLLLPAGSGVWEAVSAAVLPGSARSALELRVQEEEERQQQQQEQEQDQGYYFEGIKRAVYLVDEVRASLRGRMAMTC